MRMYKCDRCGAYVPASFKDYLRKPSRGVYRFGKKRHLCRECSRSFDEWMRGGKAERDGRR